MPTSIETRHNEKDKLYTLLSVQAGLIKVEHAINQLQAVMEKEDVKEVMETFEKNNN